MPRVCPDVAPPPSQNPVCCPNTYVQQLPGCSQQDQQDIFVNFDSFCNNDDEELGGGDDFDEEEVTYRRERKIRRAPQPPVQERRSTILTVPQAKTEADQVPPPPKQGFCQWDGVACAILIAYILALIIAILGFCYYAEDSYWNGIVHKENPFPSLDGETFFSGKYLYLYEAGEPRLQIAKRHLLRENRWMEVLHLTYIVSFLVLGFFQLASYLTRGKEDHTKFLLAFYAIFGGFGLIVGLFPLFSWNQQNGNYILSAHALQEAYNRIENNVDPESYSLYRISNATAQDVNTLRAIVKRCSDGAQGGLTMDDDSGALPLFKREYLMSELQHLGFCTHYKYKILNTIFTYVFACLCCVIPCFYCFGGSNNKYQKGGPPGMKTTMTTAAPLPPPILVQQQPPPMMMMAPPGGLLPYESNKDKSRQHRHHHHHRRHRDRSNDSGHSVKRDELVKFKRYCEGEGSEGDEFK